MNNCPQCNKRHVSWDPRCNSWLCLTVGCGYSSSDQEAIFSLRFPNGFEINDESLLSKMYVEDRASCESSGNVDFIISKWKFLCPSIQGKTNIKDDSILVPIELLRLSLLANKFNAPEGMILFQLINSGMMFIDKEGFVKTNEKLHK